MHLLLVLSVRCLIVVVSGDPRMSLGLVGAVPVGDTSCKALPEEALSVVANLIPLEVVRQVLINIFFRDSIDICFFVIAADIKRVFTS